ncbi:hypothetical protein AGLY_014972 [Aphis glycines]|uniref:Uncharacterized protein n=1 Tax=Aphis glycines TaxID=307491 RepID=A0A6G0T337_APHGL|nr:hypothetical protein AGLY_014972 [Aphis glycines]
MISFLILTYSPGVLLQIEGYCIESGAKMKAETTNNYCRLHEYQKRNLLLTFSMEINSRVEFVQHFYGPSFPHSFITRWATDVLYLMFIEINLVLNHCKENTWNLHYRAISVQIVSMKHKIIVKQRRNGQRQSEGPLGSERVQRDRETDRRRERRIVMTKWLVSIVSVREGGRGHGNTLSPFQYHHRTPVKLTATKRWMDLIDPFFSPAKSSRSLIVLEPSRQLLCVTIVLLFCFRRTKRCCLITLLTRPINFESNRSAGNSTTTASI